MLKRLAVEHTDWHGHLRCLSIDMYKREKMTWPAWRLVLPHGRHDSVRERIKYMVRLTRSKHLRPSLLSTIARSGALSVLYGARPHLLHAPLSAFVDRRFSMSRRFRGSEEDLERALAVFGEDRIASWSHGSVDCFSEPEPDLRICLSLNEVNPQEGLWALSLRDGHSARIYNLSFAFVGSGSILIASVQGPPAERESPLELIRQVTKQSHGLRPPHLLVEVLRIACREWGIRRLLAIDPSFHVKGRWNHRHRLKFDYRSLWAELGGHRGSGGYWELPIELLRRDLESVPARKRATYRRRFEMLDTVQSDLRAAWGPARK